MAERGSDILQELLDEETAERAEAAKRPRNGYMPETYDYLAEMFRRHGPVSDSGARAVANGFAVARETRRHMVFAPNPESEGAQGALLAMGEGDQIGPEGRQRLVTLLWTGEDGRVRFKPNHPLPPGAPASLVDAEGLLRTAAAEAEAADEGRGKTLRGASLSPYAASNVQRVRKIAASVWADAVGPVNDDADRQTMNRARKRFQISQARFERRRLSASLARFSRHLDPEALKILRQTGITGIRRYNWLMGDGDPALRTRRVQAAQAYPLLFGELSEQRKLTGATRAVDAGAPLAPALAADLGCSESTLRRLQGVHWQRAGKTTMRDPAGALQSLASVPTNWTPHARKEWAAFHASFAAARRHSANLGRDESAILKETGGRWTEAAEWLQEADSAGAADMSRQFHNNVVLPMIAQKLQDAGVEMAAGGDDVAELARRIGRAVQKPCKAALFGDKSLKKVGQASHRWHRTLPRIRGAMAGEDDAEIRWAPLSEPHVTKAGWSVVPLTDQAALSEEGAAMDHCVSGYADGCIRGRSHILSVRDAAGERVSTVELMEVDPKDDDDLFGDENDKVVVGERTLTVVQHMGRKNDRDARNRVVVQRGPERDAALSDYLQALAASPPDWEKVDAERAAAETELAKRQGLRATAGYDPMRREVTREVYGIYRESMIGPGRKAETPEAFLEAAGVSERIERNVAEVAEKRRLQQSEDARKEANRQAISRIAAVTEVDPDASPSGSMSYSEWFALPEERRPDKQDVVFVKPGEGRLADWHVARDAYGRPRDGDDFSAASLERFLVQRTEQGRGVNFVRAQLSGDSRKTIVAFTKDEAAAYRDVALATAEAQRERGPDGQRRDVGDVLLDRALARSGRSSGDYMECA